MGGDKLRILVTGAAGYIGSVLVPTLLQKGYEVLALDNFMYDQSSLLDCCLDKKLTIVRGDARDKNLVSKCLKSADVIFPLACLTGAPICAKDPVGARSTNLDAIKMLLDLRSRDQMIIFPNTNSGYGIGEKGILCTEKTPLRPISLYGQLKVEAELAILEAGNAITFRLATVFGISPRMRLDLPVNDFTYRAVTDRCVILFEAHFMRNYLHVRDVAKAFIHCLDNFDGMKNEPYNVGLSEANLSKWELCEEIKKQVPDFYFIESEIGEDPDKRDYVVSNAKIEASGFKPDVSLQDGIAELIKGYQVIRRNQLKTLNIAPNKIEEAVTDKTRAVMLVHTMGKPCDMDSILEIARVHNLKVIEDSCEAHGATYKGKVIGSMGDMGTFSFYAAHVLVAGEGGMVVTNNDEINRVVRSVKSHGRPFGSIYFDFQRIGFNSRMNELTAAIGLEGLEKFDSTFSQRKNNYYNLLKLLEPVSKYFYFLEEENYERVSPHAFPLVLKDKKHDCVKLYKYLESKGIQCKTIFGSLPTQHEAFKFLRHKYGQFPVSEYVGENGLHFGMHQYLTDDDLAYIADAVKGYFR